MRILAVSDTEYTGGRLEAGHYYYAEKDDSGSLQQNSLFHALLDVYFTSNCHSYPVNNADDFKKAIKLSLGVGYESYTYFIDSSNGRPAHRTCKKLEEIPKTVAIDENGEKMIYGHLKSWSDYSKKQRTECIDKLIAEMHQAGVQTKKFYEILQGLEENGMSRVSA